jgi:uncharacterized protein
MKIHILQIPVDGLRLEGEESSEILDIQDKGVEFQPTISYDVTASLAGQTLLVQGKLWTRVTLACNRCLKPFEQELRVAEFVAHRELTGEELVDLTEEVREDILLELPGYPVCRAQCKGLCPVCGQNLNEGSCSCARTSVHPSWAALEEAWRATQPKKKR